MMDTAPFPAMFVGHGSPMNAIEDSEFSLGWEAIGRLIPEPSAILCVSAHWETAGTFVTAMPSPKTIHDFAGFPPALFAVNYPAPGSPELARRIVSLVSHTPVHATERWGLDHGAWSVLRRMYPAADIPVVQLSLDATRPATWHYSLGRELRPLRDEGVLIVGSGNLVHNLGLIDWDGTAYDWASQFDYLATQAILKREHERLIRYEELGEPARLAIPTNEHYLPLLYALAVQDQNEQPHFFNERIVYGSISMRTMVIGA